MALQTTGGLFRLKFYRTAVVPKQTFVVKLIDNLGQELIKNAEYEICDGYSPKSNDIYKLISPVDPAPMTFNPIALFNYPTSTSSSSCSSLTITVTDTTMCVDSSCTSPFTHSNIQFGTVQSTGIKTLSIDRSSVFAYQTFFLKITEPSYMKPITVHVLDHSANSVVLQKVFA